MNRRDWLIKHRRNERGFPSRADPGIMWTGVLEYPIPGVRIASAGAGGRFSGAREFEHAGWSYEDEVLDVSEAHLSEGGPLGHHNSAISRRRFRRAGATGGGREGRPRQS